MNFAFCADFMKIIFFGSDEFSIKALEACLHSNMEVVLAVTVPAKKKGRGLRLEPTEIYRYCQTKKIPVAEFSMLRDPSVTKSILTLQPDIFVVASYGKIIPNELLGIPKYRLNVHPSLLPKYRGAAPVNWPILNGDAETGVSIIDIAEKMDTGNIYDQEKLALGPQANAVQLSADLAALSYGMLKKVFGQIKQGKLRGVPQNEVKATLAPQLSKNDGELFFTEPAEKLDRKVRGLQPWPGCYFFFKKERIGLLETDLPEMPVDKKPGTILSIEPSGIIIATGKDALTLVKVKPEGKKAMPAADFAHGRRLEPGSRLAD